MPSFRFLHASDLHLERPPAGLAELPDHLRELFVEAPYRAANNIFEAALRHEVDFLLLAGDVVAPDRAGPRGTLFLREQFARLAERKIAVYWAGGSVDCASSWPQAIDWPANVYICPPDRPAHFTVSKHGQSLCEIVGQSQPDVKPFDVSGFVAALPDGADTNIVVGLAHGDFDEKLLRSQRVDYWALGGGHELTLPQEMRPVVHYPGSPQGRCRDEAGPRGCTLVQVTQQGEIRTMPIITDVVRYHHERMTLPQLTAAAASELEPLLRQRMQSLAESNPEVALIVDFTLNIGESLPQQALRQLPLPAITGVLRGEFGYRSPPVWLDRIDLPPPSLPETWLQHDNLLGDFLRTARRLERASEPIDLDRYLPQGEIGERVGAVVRLNNQEMVHTAVRAAASLGVSLLYPEEAHR